jgi:Tfp pilus assembly protein PilX
MTPQRTALRNQRGFALFSTFLLLLLALTLGSAGLMYSVLELRSTTHFHTGNQAFFATESGIVHALNTMNKTGVIHFKTDIVDRWSTLYGASLKTIPGYSRLSYQVTVAEDPANPANAGSITATGTAPGEAQRVIKVRLRKGSSGSGKGAIYLAADSVSSQFSGNAFEVNGYDHDKFGNVVAGGEVNAGIATRNSGVTSGVVGSLNDAQKDNVQGLGFSMNPLTPSVVTTGGPGNAELDRMIADLVARPGVVTMNDNNINGGTLGTLAVPQITHLTANDVNFNGNVSGAGILIADGSITINGTADFVGWIIVRGETVINATANDDTTVLGNATILGSLWTGDLNVKVGGSAIIDYCDECLRLADGTGGGGSFPRPMEVASWQEVL